MKKKGKRGITLVALVVTIVVLMILAGIALTLILGQNGIIGKAIEAKNLSVNTQKSTEEGLNNLYNEMIAATGEKIVTKISDVSTISEAMQKNAVQVTSNVQLKDSKGNTVIIPAEFKIASDSAISQDNGIVIEDKDGNQFVWIPVNTIADYQRIDFKKESGDFSSYSEIMPTDEQTSINNNHGYYIGRYETGDGVSTVNKILRPYRASITNIVSVKKGQAPYNCVTRDQSKTLAEGMKEAQGYNAVTKLCSSYAWDTAINFIQKTVSNYGTTSNQGNYYNTTFNYIDIAGENQVKALNSSMLVPTGQSISESNIYDLGGNEWEWTSETYNDDVCNCTYRGGSYDAYAVNSAGYRVGGSNNTFAIGIGFRIALYL